MDLILLGDREELHREGARRFLLTLYDGLRYAEAQVFRNWRQHLHAAALTLAQEDAALVEVARTSLRALRELLEDQAAAEARCTTLEKQLDSALERAQRYRSWWENLRDTTSTANLHAWQHRTHTLEQELERAQAQHAVLETRLAEQRHCTAAREATIVELNRVIARQVAELDTLFGAAEELDKTA